MFRPSRIAMVIPMVLAGCASGFPGARPLSYVTPGEARVFATGEKCVHEPTDVEAAGLLAAVLTGAASQLLKNFGTALSEGAKGGELSSSTSTANLQLDTGKIPQCMVIVRGRFDPPEQDATPIDMGAYNGLGAADADQMVRLKSLQLPDIYQIDHYVELRILSSNNSRALTFAPLFTRLDRSIDGSTSGERDLAVAIKFNRVGADPVGSAVVIADRRVATGASIWKPRPNGRFNIEAPWFGTFHAPPASASLTGDTGGVASSTSFSRRSVTPSSTSTSIPGSPPPPTGPVGGGAGTGGGIGSSPPPPSPPIPSMHSKSLEAVPVTVTATVVETRPTNEGLAFIASVFNGIEPQIEEAIKPLIDSEARRTAYVTEATGRLNALAAFGSARGKALASLISYCSVSSTERSPSGKQDRINKSSGAQNDQIAANVAALRA